MILPQENSVPATEEAAPYSSAPEPASAQTTPAEVASCLDSVKKIRTVHLAQAKERGEKFSMLTCYDYLTAKIFDEAGIEVLLIGDSAGNNVLGHESTLSITVDQLIPLVAAVAAGSRRALVLADLPFGSYQASPAQAVETATRFMKEGGAHAVKMEASAYHAEHVHAVVNAGIPVMAHIGFTPQAEHALGGFRVQGRGDSAAKIKDDAAALVEAGAFSLLLEMTTSSVAAEIEAEFDVPTVGIGAGGATTGQVLVWQDAFGLRKGKKPRFVKEYADLHTVLLEGTRAYRAEVLSGAYPAAEHTFEN